MKKVSNTEVELKNSVAYKKTCISYRNLMSSVEVVLSFSNILEKV